MKKNGIFQKSREVNPENFRKKKRRIISVQPDEADSTEHQHTD
jgi:hypothetical protein